MSKKRHKLPPLTPLPYGLDSGVSYEVMVQFLGRRSELRGILQGANPDTDPKELERLGNILADMIELECRSDSYGRSSYWLLRNMFKINATDARFIRLLQTQDIPHRSILKEALEAYE